MELIDRATLGREIPLKVCLPCPLGEEFECIDCPLDKAMGMIEAAPTIDAVPVVRCSECKHHEDEQPGMVYCQKIVGSWVSENWFCADGERREG